MTLTDTTAGSQTVVQLDWDWATEVATVGSLVGDGTLHRVGAFKLAEVGPNGGPVWRLWMSALPDNPGNNGRFSIYPNGSNTSTKQCVLHAAQVQSNDKFIDAISAGSTLTEKLSWDPAPTAQDMVVYLKFVCMVKSADQYSQFFLLHFGNSASVGSDPRFAINFEATTVDRLRVILDNGGAIETATISTTMDPGDLVEVIGIYRANTDVRIIVRVNGVYIGSAAHSHTETVTAWASDNKLALNINNVQSSIYQRVKVVKTSAVASAVDGTENEELMQEMARLYVSDDGQRVSV